MQIHKNIDSIINVTLLILFIILISIIPFNYSNAEVPSVGEMNQVCDNWLIYSNFQRDSWAGSDNPSIINSGEIRSDKYLLARYYNIAPDGFIIVPALKELPPVKAYSEIGHFNIDQEGGIVQLLKDVLSSKFELYENYFGSLDAIPDKNGSFAFMDEYRSKWDRFTLEKNEFQADLDQKGYNPSESVGPIVASRWHQFAPYNNLCPLVDGEHVPVGCVATAAAQIMNFWQWPDSGVGDYTYFWAGEGSTPGQDLYADFSDPYDWENMPDSCPWDPQLMMCSVYDSAALAELSYEVGVALDMLYGSLGSGTWIEYALVAFAKYFKYDLDPSMKYRIDYDLNGWYSLIKSEIDANRPTFYGISGHAIVCDGYRDEGGQYEYHLNYGWTDYNAYTTWYVFDSTYCPWILEDSLCPYDEDKMIINIKPQTQPVLEMCGYSTNCYDTTDYDGHADPGETINIDVIAKNWGLDEPYNTTALMIEDDPYINMLVSTAQFDPITAGALQSSTSPFQIEISPSCPDPYIATLYIHFDNGIVDNQPFYIHIGDSTGFADSLTNDEGQWVHKSSFPSLLDEWHLDSFRFHTAPPSWKAGGSGANHFSEFSNGDLITPPFLLPLNATLSFWQWIDAALKWDSSAAWDGGLVLISSDGCEWTQIDPIGGYPYKIDRWAGNFLPDSTPCFSGTSDWHEVEFDLSGYSGVVQIMFRFSSGVISFSGTHEGWYIDDLTLKSDADLDGILDPEDNCAYYYNPNQEDEDNDGMGDLCDKDGLLVDTIVTTCTKLAVRNDGNFGDDGSSHQGMANLDFWGNGDCDSSKSAKTYLFTGSPILGYIEGSDTFAINTFGRYYTPPYAPPWMMLGTGNPTVPTQTTAEYDIFRAGTIVSPNYKIGLEEIWWAPKNPDSCGFVIQCIKLYSCDGASHSGLTIAEALDWDIPSDNWVDNSFGIDESRKLVYQRGVDNPSGPFGCQDNADRFGGTSFLGYYINDKNEIDTVSDPFGCQSLFLATYVWPHGGLIPGQIYPVLKTNGYTPNSSVGDLMSMITYFDNYTINPNDTLFIFTSLNVTRTHSRENFFSVVDKAKAWFIDNIVLAEDYICGDANNDETVNVSDAVWIINYVFVGGDPPVPYEAGNANCDGAVNVSDAVWIINYVFIGGNDPCDCQK